MMGFDRSEGSRVKARPSIREKKTTDSIAPSERA
jgi:hypothetical protein